MRRLTVPLIVALAATAAIAPGAGAHGDANGLYGDVSNGTGKLVVGYARFVTEKAHYQNVVRVCLQRWKGGSRWRTLRCEKEKHLKGRDHTVRAVVECTNNGIYRAKLFGHVKTKKGKLRHRARGTTPGKAIACD